MTEDVRVSVQHRNYNGCIGFFIYFTYNILFEFLMVYQKNSLKLHSKFKKIIV